MSGPLLSGGVPLLLPVMPHVAFLYCVATVGAGAPDYPYGLEGYGALLSLATSPLSNQLVVRTVLNGCVPSLTVVTLYK
jgi:hypothetical protein